MAADHLGIASQPATYVPGIPMGAIVVHALDASEEIDAAYTDDVELAIEDGNGTLGGTLTVAAVAGVATFSTVTNTIRETITLTATSGALTEATTDDIASGATARVGSLPGPITLDLEPASTDREILAPSTDGAIGFRGLSIYVSAAATVRLHWGPIEDDQIVFSRTLGAAGLYELDTQGANIYRAVGPVDTALNLSVTAGVVSGTVDAVEMA